jgi:hypothetical protein
MYRFKPEALHSIYYLSLRFALLAKNIRTEPKLITLVSFVFLPTISSPYIEGARIAQFIYWLRTDWTIEKSGVRFPIGGRGPRPNLESTQPRIKLIPVALSLELNLPER